VHISELSDRFVKDPHEIVKAGEVVKVRVKDVDVPRKRIALTMKSGAIDTSSGAIPGARPPSSPPARNTTAQPPRTSEAPAESALAAALRRAQDKGR
jgi:uncharacterized protein